MKLRLRSFILLLVAVLSGSAFQPVQAATIISDFTNTGFTEVNPDVVQTTGPTFVSLFGPATGGGVGGAFTYADLDLTGLTGFNVTYSITLQAGTPSATLTLQTRDSDGTFGSSTLAGVTTGEFVTVFIPAPLPFNPGTIDPAHITRIGLSASNFSFSATNLTLKVDNITAVPEPGSMSLILGACAVGGILLVRRQRKARTIA
ncbi:MAG TPA: PEP-CTERM sorting domain-containing protein [Chthoniobacterales bacterium]|jgi:hypothetical protein